ncbi:MAG: hypothetical protein ACTSQJ_12515, partial [Promethearchaeota archaeon]
YILPLFLRKDPKVIQIKENSEITLAFYLLTKNLKEEEKIISFSRLLWPLLSIQSIISTHIILDGLKLFSKKGKFSNPPRQPLIGHILRNVENRTEIEQLNRIIEVLSYEDSQAQEIGEGEESEYQTLKIESLINPEFLDTLMKLIPHLESQPITDYMPLDASLSTEKALEISEQYRNIIDTMKGNALRWETVSELIKKEVDKWIIDLKVKLKDIDLRYSSQINKTSSTIDSTQIEEKLKKERDKIDQWKVNEKKKVIENLVVLFKTIERHMEEMLKKNRFFSRDDTLKSKILEELVPSFEKHFDYLRNEGKKLLELVETLHQQYMEQLALKDQIDFEAEESLEKLQIDLNLKLQDRNKQVSEFEKEKREEINKLEELLEEITKLNDKINEIIQKKKRNCLKEAEDLINWSIKDDQSELFTKPIQWIYMPLYAMFIEDEEMMEEQMKVVFPGYVSKETLFEDVSDAMIELREFLNEKIEDDMKIRSNFEFSCENKNLLEDPNLTKKIQKGISILRSNNLITEEIEQQIRKVLKLISN